MEPGELLALHFFLFLGEHLGVERFQRLEQVPEDARQLMRHGRDSLGRAQPRLPAAVEVAKVILRGVQALRGQAQRRGGPALHVAR